MKHTITMILKKLTSNLMVRYVNRTVGFFKDILGLELGTTVPENGFSDKAQHESIKETIGTKIV